MTLSKKQVKQLRALANSLKPLIIIGKQDLSDSVVAQVNEVLEDHELVKGKILDGSGLDAKEAALTLAQTLNADVVQTIGNRFIIFRRSKKKTIKHIDLVRE
ncbi:MAG: YhbY family RNA-binding protein [Bifidobacteriaceae bacterium]|nr:YhbY family RNA-binding protein [Bifidobacteriaceae bacterium]